MVLLQHLLALWWTLSSSVRLRCLSGYGNPMSRLRGAKESRADLMAQMISPSFPFSPIQFIIFLQFVYNSGDA